MQIIPYNKIITNINSTKFLGSVIDSTFSWNDNITRMTTKLNKACYAITAINTFMSLDVI